MYIKKQPAKMITNLCKRYIIFHVIKIMESENGNCSVENENKLFKIM